MSANDFAIAVAQIRASSAPTSNDTKLRLYALYKQATIGKCTTAKPWAIRVTECAKWEAWHNLQDVSQEEAMKQYCDLAKLTY